VNAPPHRARPASSRFRLGRRLPLQLALGTSAWLFLALLSGVAPHASSERREQPAKLVLPGAGSDSFRLIADLDGDARCDTFGYSQERPWNLVHFASASKHWTARPGEGIEETFAVVNQRLWRDIVAEEPDPEKQRQRYARYRICADNVEHGPVLFFEGRLVVLWYMEPLYPAGINTYDLDGRLLSRYVHPGHLRSLSVADPCGSAYVVFGGTNNFVDRPRAAREGRGSLNLPVLGAIRLGEDGLDPALARVLEAASDDHPVARVPFYRVVDRDRNSQVIRISPRPGACRFEVVYEPGSTSDGGYAPMESTQCVDLCEALHASPRPSIARMFAAPRWDISSSTRDVHVRVRRAKRRGST
jgi:hypothetical protein